MLIDMPMIILKRAARKNLMKMTIQSKLTIKLTPPKNQPKPNNKNNIITKVAVDDNSNVLFHVGSLVIQTNKVQTPLT
jgi:hypothetical protein